MSRRTFHMRLIEPEPKQTQDGCLWAALVGIGPCACVVALFLWLMAGGMGQ